MYSTWSNAPASCLNNRIADIIIDTQKSPASMTLKYVIECGRFILLMNLTEI